MTGIRRLRVFVIALALAPSTSDVFAQQPAPVIRGLEFLRARAGQGETGEAALSALVMLKADTPAGDPALDACLKKIDGRFNGSAYQPERRGGTEIYEAAVVIMALATLDSNGRKAQIESVARYIISRQRPRGGWDYDGRDVGDCSISQYAILGLWEADNAGVRIDPSAWDKAAQFYLSVQAAGGSWNYHRDESGTYPETISMTAAGVGSLLICRRQLEAYQRVEALISPLLTPIVSGDPRNKRYRAEVSNAKLNAGIRAGLGWLNSNFTVSNSPIIGQSPYYGLYGIERIGALADQATIGRVDWYQQGSAFISSTQSSNGGWNATHGEVANSAWALLFLVKSTAKSVQKIQLRRLGAGELRGGKGLPKDLSTISVAAGRVVARPMDGAVEGMLTVLEDPRAESADSALAGLVVRYHSSGAKALRPHQDRFRKLLNDRDPGVRRVAAWALARTGDIAMVPVLIDALRDPDAEVAREAKSGLELIGRNIKGFGPALPAAPEETERAMQAWKAWYDSVRPLSVDRDDPRATGSGPAGGRTP